MYIRKSPLKIKLVLLLIFLSKGVVEVTFSEEYTYFSEKRYFTKYIKTLFSATIHQKAIPQYSRIIILPHSFPEATKNFCINKLWDEIQSNHYFSHLINSQQQVRKIPIKIKARLLMDILKK